METVWIAGEMLSFGTRSWNFLGVFNSKGEAEEQATTSRHFVFEAQIGSTEPMEPLPDRPFIYPLAQE